MRRVRQLRRVLIGLVAGLGLVVMIAPRPGPAAVQKDKLTVETVAYQGWKNNLRLSNGDAELLITLDVGPRILSYRLANRNNVLKEFADQLGQAGEKEWMIRGGHRLWVAPEDTTRTYALDNRAGSGESRAAGEAGSRCRG